MLFQVFLGNPVRHGLVKVGELEQQVEYLSCHFFLAVHVPDCLSVDICMNDSPQDFYIEATPFLAGVATLLPIQYFRLEKYSEMLILSLVKAKNHVEGEGGQIQLNDTSIRYKS